MGDVEVVMRFQEGLGEADYVNVLIEEEIGEFWYFVEDALGVRG